MHLDSIGISKNGASKKNYFSCQMLSNSRILLYYRGPSFKITMSKLVNSPFKYIFNILITIQNLFTFFYILYYILLFILLKFKKFQSFHFLLQLYQLVSIVQGVQVPLFTPTLQTCLDCTGCPSFPLPGPNPSSVTERFLLTEQNFMYSPFH